MTDDNRSPPDWFSKPGDSIRALLQRGQVSTVTLSEGLEGGTATLRGLMDGSIPIDQNVARTLAASLGGTPSFWLKRQANYESALERAVKSVTDNELDEWLQVPSPAGRVHGAMSAKRRRDELRRQLIFFNVSNIGSWKCRYGDVLDSTRFRTSRSFSSNDNAVLMWLRRGELEADLVATRSWNSGNLYDRLTTLRGLVRISQPARFLPKLKEICAEAGVAIVVVKAPQGCRVSGASRLITPDKAMILLSFRYRVDDQFWFTLFHEVGHLLLHGDRTFVDDENTVDDESEREANEFASHCIIPKNRRFRISAADC